MEDSQKVKENGGNDIQGGLDICVYFLLVFTNKHYTHPDGSELNELNNKGIHKKLINIFILEEKNNIENKYRQNEHDFAVGFFYCVLKFKLDKVKRWHHVPRHPPFSNQIQLNPLLLN